MSIPDKVLDGIDRLEPLPITVQKLLVALNDKDIRIDEITDAIQYDGAITANILRTANSAAFGGRARIEHTRDAVIRLGTVTLLDILLIGHLRIMKTAAPLHNLSEDDFWLHSATSSLAAKAIAKETRNRKIPEAATVAALIHDIGKLVMGRYLKAEPLAVQKLCEEKNLSFVDAETELFGCNHAEVGAAMALKWSFPEPITQTIQRHHETAPGNANLLLDTVILADWTAKSTGAESGTEINGRAEIAAAQQSVGLTADGLKRVCQQTAEWASDLKTSYGFSPRGRTRTS